MDADLTCILSVAGSDSGCAAGVQADVKTIAANGGYAVTAVTAVTAQTDKATLDAVPMSSAILAAQLDAVADGFEIAAAKSGMLATAELVATLAQAFQRRPPPHYVLDPVIASTSGWPLLTEQGIAALRRELLPLATLVTPNIAEAEQLSGRSIRSLADAADAAKAIADLGCGAVLVKGGHLDAAPGADVLLCADGVRVLHGEFLCAAAARGTGCAYSAAIATRLGLGSDLHDAVCAAKRYVTEAIRHRPRQNRVGPLAHFHGPR